MLRDRKDVSGFISSMPALPERDEARTIHHRLTRPSKKTIAGTTNHLVANTFSQSWYTINYIRVKSGSDDYPVEYWRIT